MFLRPFAFFILSLCFTSAHALTKDQVTEKFDSIIVFAPVESGSDVLLRPIDITVDGEKQSIYYAAFSHASVKRLVEERIKPQSSSLASGIKFAPFSLAKFDQLVQIELSKNDGSRVSYVPDPAQVSVTKELLLAQGSSLKDATAISKALPVVFCPQPSIKATPKSGPMADKPFIPCSTDFKTVKSFVDKGISSSPSLRTSTIKVVAIPLSSFASILFKGSDADFGDLRVLPTPASINAVNELKSNSKP